MSEYIKHKWVKGEEITSAKLNNLETGIAEAHKAAELLAIALANFVQIGGNEPAHGPVIWFDTSPRVPDTPESDDYIFMLDLGGEEDETPVTATIDGEDYPVLNLTEPEITESGGNYHITIT